ncbi:MAG: histidinol dehydrogenase, partial [Proteobacteria bacterium]|nr:histidinol dehydrogenase [Pseudomonadota bacterium]
MGINIWNWGEIDKGVREKILNRAQNNIDAVMDAVRPIITAVQQRGDPALLQFTKEFDKTEVKGGLRVTEAEFAEARESLDPDLVKAIRSCAGYVRKHHMQQMAHVKPLWFEEVQPGVYAGEKITPVDSVGLYVPRGKGAFPSVMYMLCLPAVVAGVKKIVVVTPPTPEGGVDAASLVAADACGVREVYKVGGAQAIAALA